METVSKMDKTIYFDKDHLYSIKFLAEALGVSQSYIKKRIDTGEIRGEKMAMPTLYKNNIYANRSKYMITGSEIARFLLLYFKKNYKVVTKVRQHPYLNLAKIT